MPYQLHCEPVVAQFEEIELDTTEDDELLGVELELEAIELGTEELVTTLEQTEPVIVGFSAELLLFLLPWTPKLTDCPG